MPYVKKIKKKEYYIYEKLTFFEGPSPNVTLSPTVHFVLNVRI